MKKHERKVAYSKNNGKERHDLAEAHKIALQHRDAELVDLDAEAREWATNHAKAKTDRARIAAILSGSELQHSDAQPAARAEPIMVSFELACKIKNALQIFSTSLPPNLSTAIAHAVNTTFEPPSCLPAATPEMPPAALPETAPAAVPATLPAALPLPELPEPPTWTGEMAKVKGGKGPGAGKGERLAPYDAGP